MYIQVNNPIGNGYVMPILNSNYITEDKKKAEIKAMGMAACQTKCLRCGHCSADKCGNRS